MSISGAVMISVTVLVRALFIRRLPKKTFHFLWWVVSVRLLVPYSLPCAFSVYSLFLHSDPAPKTANEIIVPFIPNISAEASSVIPPDVSGVPSLNSAVDICIAVWLVGVLALAAFFAFSYIKCLRRFRESLPVDSDLTKQWLTENRLCRNISIRYSDRISSPLTYGIFRPVILLPKNFDLIDPDDLEFVLAHEYTHIRRFDTLFKLVLAAALCVHWFNPFVWLMYILANRDIEFACDEGVVRMFDSDKRQAYAMALIHMEEVKSGLTTITNSFGKHPIQERIVSIMKFKKLTVSAAAAAVFLVAGTFTVFATTPAKAKSADIYQQTSEPNGSTTVSSSTDEMIVSNTIPDVSEPVMPDDGKETPGNTSSSDNDNINLKHSDSPYRIVTALENDKLFVTFYPVDSKMEPITKTVAAEKVITFESEDKILIPNGTNHELNYKWNEDGSVTVRYFNFGDKPLDFTNAQIMKPDDNTHVEYIG